MNINVTSELPICLDLIIDCYKTYNPIIISEKLEEEFDIHLTIDQVIDYFETHNNNYKLIKEEMIKQQYYEYY